MSGPLPPNLAEALAYLAEIGYGELYLPAGGVPEPRRQRTAPPAAPRPPAAGPAASAPPAPSPPIAGGLAARPSSDGVPAAWSSLAELGAFVQGCTRCRLAEGRQRVVFGDGDPDADLMFIGEGPGAEEDRRGLPFVGPAGGLLTKIIQAIGLEREQVYIANIVKCRPPRNRDPQPDEVAACRGYLEAQIDFVRPRVIVALGRVAAQTLLGNDLPLGRMRGQWYRVRGVDTRVTYHPAGLLRNASWKRPCWEDMQIVRDRLQEA